MQSNIAPQAMVVTPHHLATQTAISILKEGGTAIEAMVAAAATIAVVYPHMNSIGGDSFWLIVPPEGEPIVIEACGAAGSLATKSFYDGLEKVPYKGPKAASTVAGTVGGWEEALKYVSESGYQRISISRLLADAIKYAEEGFPVTNSQKQTLEDYKARIHTRNGLNHNEFDKVFLPNGKIPEVGDICYQKQLAKTFRNLVDDGLNSFYKGKVAQLIAEDAASLGMPITAQDLESYSPVRKVPLRLLHSRGELYNLPPPTQGLISLTILGILDKLNIDGKNEGEFVHSAIEATKLAFQIRDNYVTDPQFMKVDPKNFLTERSLLNMANEINPNRAVTLTNGKGPGDTVWMGIMDNRGYSVSFIQSVYYEFGSEIVLPKTGILWQNRGVSFSLKEESILSIQPGKKPFHTLNPAAAKLNDGRLLVYGTRGGDGQPQTQSAIFHRYVIQNKNLQAAVSAPRWVYGATAGDSNTSVHLESRFDEETINYLRERGHDIVMLPAFTEEVGQAGALVRHTNGMIEGAFDPRSDGSAGGF